MATVSQSPRQEGSLVIDRGRHAVYCRGVRLDLSWRSVELLAILLDADGGVISKEVLSHRLWPGTAIDESSLTKLVSQLRKVLAEVDPGREYLETVPRLGYRLALPIVEAQQAPLPPLVAGRSLFSRRWVLAAAAGLPVGAWAGYRGWLSWDRRSQAEFAYQQGLRLLRVNRDPESIAQSAVEFRRAIELDPRFARAYASLAHALAMAPAEDPAPALEAARRAVELDPRCGECAGALGFVQFLRFWQWEEAGRHYQRAIALAPRDSQVRLLASQQQAISGDYDAALANIDFAARLDPLNHGPIVVKASILYLARRFEEAVAAADRAIALNYRNSGGWEWKSRTLFHVGRHSEALEATYQMRTEWQPTVARAITAFHARGLSAAMDTLLRETEGLTAKANFPYYRAGWNLLAGRPQAAIAELETIVRLRRFNAIYIGADPMFDPLRSDSRFVALLQRLNFPRRG